MRLALQLARRGYGCTSPNPMVGAVIVKGGKVIGSGWHHRAGKPHAEIEALLSAARKRNDPAGATLYVSLEPCCTHGRTPPCTEAIKAAGFRRVVIGASDPNPAHSGRAYSLLKRARIAVTHGVLEGEATRLNEAFNYWIVHRRPFVTLKAAMTLDGKIATSTGESKWITSERSRAFAMKLRRGADAILVGINTVLSDDPALTIRGTEKDFVHRQPRRIVLDSLARTPLNARLVTDEFKSRTTIVVTKAAPSKKVAGLARQVQVIVAPERNGRPNLRWLLDWLGEQDVTSLLVEGGGETHAAFLESRKQAHRVAFFYAPKVIGGRDARRAVGGGGAKGRGSIRRLEQTEWQRLGEDLLLTGTLA